MPASTQPADAPALRADWQAKYTAARAAAPEAYAEEFGLIYEDRLAYLEHNLEQAHYLFEPALQRMLDSLTQRLLSATPAPTDPAIQILVGRYAAPNAFSLGDGTIVFNVGLLRRLETVEQIAFVLAHEIAHVRLAHLEHRLTERYALNNDKARTKELKRLTREENVAAVLAMLQTTLYDQRRHGREDEAAADALAVELLAAAGLPTASARSCLGLLDTIDRRKYPAPLDLTALLHTEAYPVKAYWLERPPLLFGGEMTNDEEEYWSTDSLRTHPDCPERIALLPAAPPAPATRPNPWQRWADHEMILGQLHFGDYGTALYHALKLRGETGEDDPWTHCLVGRALNGTCAATLRHEFDAAVPTPRSRPEEDWQDLMRMLRKMRSRETRLLAHHYLAAWSARFPDYAPLREELTVSTDQLDPKN